MKYNFNNKTINIPTGYNELTFKQMRDLIAVVENKESEEIDYICCLTDIPRKELLKYPASEYIKITYYFADWVNEIPDLKNIILPSEVLINGKKHKIPKDIGNLNVEAFEVCRVNINRYTQNNLTYLDLCGIIAQNYFSILANDNNYNPWHVNAFEDTVLNMDWQTVVSFGNFFLQKYKELIRGTKKELKNRGTHKTRLVRGIKNWLKRGAFFTR